MYFASLVQFKLGTGQRLVAERLTKQFDPGSRALFGFRGNVYFFDDKAGEYRALSYWDTKKAAQDAHKLLSPKFEKELINFTLEKPIYKLFEVFDAADDASVLASHTV